MARQESKANKIYSVIFVQNTNFRDYLKNNMEVMTQCSSAAHFSEMEH